MRGDCNCCGQDVGVYSMTQKPPEFTYEFENEVVIRSVGLGIVIGMIIGCFIGLVI